MNKKISFLTPIRIGMVVILLVFIVLLQVGSKNSSSSISTVTKSVIKSIKVDGMEESSNRLFKKFYGLNANDYEGVTLYAPITNMNAEELLIIKLKDRFLRLNLSPKQSTADWKLRNQVLKVTGLNSLICWKIISWMYREILFYILYIPMQQKPIRHSATVCKDTHYQRVKG